MSTFHEMAYQAALSPEAWNQATVILGTLLSQLARWAEVARVTFSSALYIDCTNDGPHSEHFDSATKCCHCWANLRMLLAWKTQGDSGSPVPKGPVHCVLLV